MLNTYVDNESKYLIKFTYQSLNVNSIDSIGLKSKRVTITRTPIINGGTVITSPKIGINFSLYNKVTVVE